MRYEFQEMRGLDCPKKYVIKKGEQNLFFVNTFLMASKCIAYLEGYAVKDLDIRVTKFLDKFKNIKKEG